MGETELGVERDRGMVAALDAGDHDVLADIAGTAGQLDHQGLAEAVATLVGADADGVIDGVAVAVPGTSVIEGGGGDGLIVVVRGDKDGIARLLAVGQPGQPIGLVDGGRSRLRWCVRPRRSRSR
ncbi:MAG: hypothetical protein QM695_06015 [Micropruina sp.]